MLFTLRILQSTLFVTALMSATLLSLFVQSSFANSDGRRTTRTILNSTSCGGVGCHGTSTPNTAVRLWAFANNQRIADSIVVMPGARVRLTVMVAHSNSGAGINVAVRAGLTGEVSVGTVTPADNSIAVRGTTPSTELTHTQAKGKAQGDSAITFSFDWQAPTATGTYFLRAIGNAVNNNGIPDASDAWNWLQPLRLVVTSVVSVQSPEEGLGQFDVAPNPISGSSTFSWTLPTGTAFANALNGIHAALSQCHRCRAAFMARFCSRRSRSHSLRWQRPTRHCAVFGAVFCHFANAPTATYSHGCHSSLIVLRLSFFAKKHVRYHF